MAPRKKQEDKDFARTTTVSAGRVSPGAFVAAGVVNPAFPTGPVATLITVTPTATNLAPGSTQQFAASVRDQSNNIMAAPSVTWSSSNTAVATVNGSGLVTAVAQGTCDIRATSGTAQSAPYTVVVGLIRNISVTSGDSQSATLATALTNPLVATVVDGAAQPVANEKVTWTSTDSSGDVFPAFSFTGANGQTSITYKTGTQTGTFSVIGTTSTGATCTFTVTATAAAATNISFTTGFFPVSAPVSTVLSGGQKPAVLITDQFGNPKSGTTVTFAVTGGGGSGSGLSVVSSASGEAVVGGWTLGASPGANTMTATAAGLTGSPVTFTVQGTTVGLTPTRIVSNSGFAQTGIAAGSAAAAIVVKVDNGTTPVQGVSVAARVLIGSGSFAVSTVTTDVNGLASFTYTTHTTAETATVDFSANNGIGVALTNSPLSTTIASVAASANKLAFTDPPASNINNGGALGTIRVQVQDANGNATATSGVTITLTDDNANVALGGTLTGVTNTSGYVDFFNITATGGGTFHMLANGGGFVQATSIPVTIAPPIATKLVIAAGAPTSGFSGLQVGTINVNVTDAFGTLVSGSGISIDASVGAGVTLAGTHPLNAVSGVGSFTNLAVTTTAATATITFSAAGLASASLTLSISQQSSLFPNKPSWATYEVMRFNCDVPTANITTVVPAKFISTPGGTHGYFWRNGNFNKVAGGDPTAPVDGANVYQTTYTTSTKPGTAPCDFSYWDNINTATSGKSTLGRIYFAHVFKYVANPVDGLWEAEANGQKNGFLGSGSADGQTANQIIPFVVNGTAVPNALLSDFMLEIRTQGNGGGQRNYSTNRSGLTSQSRPIKVGRWHTLEMALEQNTIASVTGPVAGVYKGNGTLNVWLDGVLIMQYTDCAWRIPSATNQFFFAYWNPTFGGGQTPFKTRNDIIYHNLFYIAGDTTLVQG